MKSIIRIIVTAAIMRYFKILGRYDSPKPIPEVSSATERRKIARSSTSLTDPKAPYSFFQCTIGILNANHPHLRLNVGEWVAPATLLHKAFFSKYPDIIISRINTGVNKFILFVIIKHQEKKNHTD
jgi:hypothetical protein